METKRQLFEGMVKTFYPSTALLQCMEQYDNAPDDVQTDKTEPNIHEMALRMMGSGRSDVYTVEDAYEFALALYAEGKDFDDWAKDNLDAFVEHYKQNCVHRYEVRRQS